MFVSLLLAVVSRGRHALRKAAISDQPGRSAVLRDRSVNDVTPPAPPTILGLLGLDGGHRRSLGDY
jgi:hypothetical protein